MRLYTCVFIHVAVYLFVYTCSCILVCLYMWLYTCLFIHVAVYLFVYTCGCILVCLYMWLYTCLFIHVAVYLFVYTCGCILVCSIASGECQFLSASLLNSILVLTPENFQIDGSKENCHNWLSVS